MPWKEQADLYRADDMAVIKSGFPKIGFEEPQTTPKGDTIWLRTSKVPLRSPDGVIQGILGTYEDITSSKEAKDKLIELNTIISFAHTHYPIAVYSIAKGYFKIYITLIERWLLMLRRSYR